MKRPNWEGLGYRIESLLPGRGCWMKELNSFFIAISNPDYSLPPEYGPYVIGCYQLIDGDPQQIACVVTGERMDLAALNLDEFEYDNSNHLVGDMALKKLLSDLEDALLRLTPAS